jgi:transcriptional regulator with XRE-family HTH domain/phage repressor protein C with HTH and peptisase S24 domain
MAINYKGIIERITKVRKDNGLSQEKFADDVGVSRSVLSQIEIGKILPSLEIIAIISSKFNVPYIYLIDGVDTLKNAHLIAPPIAHLNEGIKGSNQTVPKTVPFPVPNDDNHDKIKVKKTGGNLKNSEKEVIRMPEVVTVDKDGDENIVLVDQKAAAGYLTGLKDENYIKQLPAFRLPGYYGKTYRAFEVIGDSMHDTLWPNDIVVCSWVEDSRHLKDNYIHVLVCEDGSIIVKRIINKIEQHQYVVIKSDNAVYPPDKVYIDNIREFWFVHAKISCQMPPPDQTEKRLSDLEWRFNMMETSIKKIDKG